MSVTRVKCPGCSTEGTMSLIEPDFEGAYACWKCHQLCNIKIERGVLVSALPVSQEEAEEIRRTEAARRRGRA